MASLESCKAELSGIIRDLTAIQEGINRDFTGIGQDLCAKSIGVVVGKYQGMLSLLNTIDPNRLAEWAMKDEEEG